MMSRPRFWFLATLTVLAAVSRVLPHPPNFTPTMAIALFGAATFGSFRSAILVSFGALLASDAILQLTYQLGWQPSRGFYQGQWVVYSCVAATMLIGASLRNRRNVATIGAAALASSLLFFVATNFAVWASDDLGTYYPRTMAGLVLCYEAALPFFRNSLAGDACFTLALFGSLALAEARFPAVRSARPATVSA
ncbi:DUF6580 family putative transport protein [Tundrisphaera lichenicola]|uniref:DUF6580 family putative transport protein n=1 Tax=Tundrisphaera lichenicola TaxID=2029860 RepID=UPI003EBF3789